MVSQGFRLRAKTTTFGSNSEDSSRVPRVMVTTPIMPLLRPRIGLPHAGQKTLVTSFPLSDLSLYSAICPVRRNLSIENIAPVECPAPLPRWQSLQWQ